jgi:hypothetical protein
MWPTLQGTILPPAAGRSWLALPLYVNQIGGAMDGRSKEYRFACLEAYRITLTRLENQFQGGAVNLEEMEIAVPETPS